MSLKRLHELRSTVKALQKQIEALQQQVATLVAAAGDSDDLESFQESRDAA